MNHFRNFIDASIQPQGGRPPREPARAACPARLATWGTSPTIWAGEQGLGERGGEGLVGSQGLDDNLATLDRTLKHLTDNGVDLQKYPISMGPLLAFDPEKSLSGVERGHCSCLADVPGKFVCPKAAESERTTARLG